MYVWCKYYEQVKEYDSAANFGPEFQSWGQQPWSTVKDVGSLQMTGGNMIHELIELQP